MQATFNEVKGKKKSILNPSNVNSPDFSCSQKRHIHIGSTKSQSSTKQLKGAKKASKENKENEDQIRIKLDQNLSQIFSVLKQRGSNSRAFKQVPKLSHNLVHNYVKLIYQEYSIVDPLGQQDVSPYRILEDSKNYQISEQNSYEKQQYLQEKQFLEEKSKDRIKNNLQQNSMENSTQKGYKVRTFSPSGFDGEHSHENSLSKQNRRTTGGILTNDSKISDNANLYPRRTMNSNFSGNEETKQIFRYCFICERLVLQANISFHQQKCSMFSNLYSMDLGQIKQQIVNKIKRIKGQLQQCYLKFQKNSDFHQNVQKINQSVTGYLHEVQKGIRGEGQNQRNLLQASFCNIMNSYDDQYFKIYESVRKLHWFSLMLDNLERKYPESKTEIQIQNHNFPQRISSRRFSAYH